LFAAPSRLHLDDAKEEESGGQAPGQGEEERQAGDPPLHVGAQREGANHLGITHCKSEGSNTGICIKK